MSRDPAPWRLHKHLASTRYQHGCGRLVTVSKNSACVPSLTPTSTIMPPLSSLPVGIHTGELNPLFVNITAETSISLSLSVSVSVSVSLSLFLLTACVATFSSHLIFQNLICLLSTDCFLRTNEQKYSRCKLITRLNSVLWWMRVVRDYQEAFNKEWFTNGSFSFIQFQSAVHCC